MAEHCVFCRAPVDSDVPLCRGCRDDIAWLHHSCRYCALALADATPVDVCPQCRSRAAFDAALAVTHYDDAMAWLIRGLKFRGHLAHARILARLMADTWTARNSDRPDCLVPIPLHPSSFRRRGFNQAERIAHHLGRWLDIPVEIGILTRARATARQSGLDARERARNVRGAFHADVDANRYTHVALVDDVLTTGRTAQAAASALRAAGITRVDCYAAARA